MFLSTNNLSINQNNAYHSYKSNKSVTFNDSDVIELDSLDGDENLSSVSEEVQITKFRNYFTRLINQIIF